MEFSDPMPATLLAPASIADLQAAVRDHAGTLCVPRGAGTKTALATPPDGVTPLDLTALSGMIEYAPGEFTFTALAGTRITAIAAILAEHGQYLPCDPLLADAGATLGGTVAAGANGPGRYRYGGLRDFILGVRYVDGAGDLVYAGGKVVKNAAGFDVPKLMVGSLGQFGVLAELTFKVFPKPEAYATLRLDLPSVAAGVAALIKLTAQPLDLDSLDLTPTAAGATLWVRLAGLAGALPARIERLRGVLGGGEKVAEPEEGQLWRAARELTWVPPVLSGVEGAGWSLVKVPVTPKKIVALDQRLTPDAIRRYSVAGQVAWIATPDRASLDAALTEVGLSGLALVGPAGKARLGIQPGTAFERRVKQALDPSGRFPSRI
jgi:glycolate oxidase FAD binding subunit